MNYEIIDAIPETNTILATIDRTTLNTLWNGSNEHCHSEEKYLDCYGENACENWFRLKERTRTITGFTPGIISFARNCSSIKFINGQTRTRWQTLYMKNILISVWEYQFDMLNINQLQIQEFTDKTIFFPIPGNSNLVNCHPSSYEH